MKDKQLKTKDYSEATKFISENMKAAGMTDGGPRFNVTQEHYHEFLGSRGITDETIKQMADASSEYNNGTVNVLKNMLIEDPSLERAVISTRTKGGPLAVRMLRRFDTKVPSTGQPLVKFGVVTISQKLKSRLDPDLLRSCGEEITAGE